MYEIHIKITFEMFKKTKNTFLLNKYESDDFFTVISVGSGFPNFTLGFMLYCERNTLYNLQYPNGIWYKKSFNFIYLINIFVIHKCVANIEKKIK